MAKKVTPKLIMAILSAGMLSFLGILDETATTVTFPTLISEFAVTTDQVQWVNTLVLLVIATIVPISSQIGLRFTTKQIFMAGIAFFMAGLLIDIFAQRFDLLLLGRALQGVGTGIGLPLMYNIILTKVPKDKLGFMMGIGTMITAAAVALGPVFGGIVTDRLTWRWIFIISSLLALISAFTGSYSIPQLNKLQKVRFKYGQWLAIAVSLVLLMLGFTSLAKQPFWSVQVTGCLGGGLIGLGIWLKISWRDHQALISPRLFANLHFSMQLTCYCFAKIATLALGFIFPIYVQTVNHGSVSLAGWIMFPGAICDAVMAALAGKILDKLRARLPILLGMLASLASLILLAVWGLRLSNLAIVLLDTLYYGGYGMSFSSLMTSGLTALAAEEHPQGNAIFNTLQQFSGALGTALAGTLLAISQHNHQLVQQQTTAMGARWTFIILVGLIIVSLIFAVLFVSRTKPQVVQNS